MVLQLAVSNSIHRHPHHIPLYFVSCFYRPMEQNSPKLTACYVKWAIIILKARKLNQLKAWSLFLGNLPRRNLNREFMSPMISLTCNAVRIQGTVVFWMLTMSCRELKSNSLTTYLSFNSLFKSSKFFSNSCLSRTWTSCKSCISAFVACSFIKSWKVKSNVKLIKKKSKLLI